MLDNSLDTLVLRYEFNPEEAEIINDYLDGKLKQSTNSFKSSKEAIYNCLNYVNDSLAKLGKRGGKSLMRDYLKKIDSKKVKYTTKMEYRRRLNQFFEYVEERFEELDVDFSNPIPSLRVFSFTKTAKDLEEVDEKERKFSQEELLDIMRLTKSRNLRDFIFFGILVETGMRVSECITIKIENVDIEKRIIKTGVVKDHMKSKKLLKFFFTEKFGKYLDLYITYLDREAGWLFQGKKIHLNENAYYIYVKNNYGDNYNKFHKFRRSIITRRIVEMGCPDWISEGLTNHKITNSTQRKHYVSLSDDEKRDLYDKWFPYSFVPYF